MVLCCARAGEEKEDLGRPGRNWIRLDWRGFQSSGGVMSGQCFRSSSPSLPEQLSLPKATELTWNGLLY